MLNIASVASHKTQHTFSLISFAINIFINIEQQPTKIYYLINSSAMNTECVYDFTFHCYILKRGSTTKRYDILSDVFSKSQLLK